MRGGKTCAGLDPARKIGMDQERTGGGVQRLTNWLRAAGFAAGTSAGFIGLAVLIYWLTVRRVTVDPTAPKRYRGTQTVRRSGRC